LNEAFHFNLDGGDIELRSTLADRDQDDAPSKNRVLN